MHNTQQKSIGRTIGCGVYETPVFESHYPHVTHPWGDGPHKGKRSISALFDPYVADLSVMRGAVAICARSYWPPRTRYRCPFDNQLVFMRVARETDFSVPNWADGTPIESDDDIRPGTPAIAGVSFFCYDLGSGSRGVAVELKYLRLLLLKGELWK